MENTSLRRYHDAVPYLGEIIEFIFLMGTMFGFIIFYEDVLPFEQFSSNNGGGYNRNIVVGDLSDPIEKCKAIILTNLVIGGLGCSSAVILLICRNSAIIFSLLIMLFFVVPNFFTITFFYTTNDKIDLDTFNSFLPPFYEVYFLSIAFIYF